MNALRVSMPGNLQSKVRTLDPREKDIVQELTCMERKIFPKNESLSDDFIRELRRRNTRVLYAIQDEHTENPDGQTVYKGPNGAAIAGYIMFTHTSVAASITKLAVREKCRRQGYGEELVKAALEMLRSRKVLCVNLHVDVTRLAAISLYRKYGFQVDTLVESYYNVGRDAYRMILSLESDF